MSWPALALLEVQGVGLLWVMPLELGSPSRAIECEGLDIEARPTGAEERVRGLVTGDLDLLLSTGTNLQPRAAQITIARQLAVGVRGRGWVWVLREAPTAGQSLVLRTADLVAVGRLAEAQTDTGWTSFSVVEDPLDDRGLLLDSGAAVSPETWPRSDDQRADDGEAAFLGTPAVPPQSEGQPYPVIIGGPGRGVPIRGLGVIATTDLPAAPAILVETSNAPTSTTDHQLVVSSGRIDATTVRRIGTDQNGAPTAEDCTVTVGHDAQGRIVSLISPGSALDVPTDDSESWSCLVDGYGIADPFGSGPLRRADHVLRWALSRSTLRVDHRSIPRLSALAAFKIDTAIYSQVGAWAWVQSQLLPALPIAVATGPRGLFFWADVPTVAHKLAICTLTVGEGCARVGPVVALDPDPVTHLVCTYAPDARTGRGARMVRVHPMHTSVGPNAGALPSMWAARAYADYGRRDATLDLPITADQATAERLALLHVERRCRPRFEVAAVVRESHWQSLVQRAPLPGDLVRFADATLGVDALAAVHRVGYSGAAYTLGLRWWARLGSEG